VFLAGCSATISEADFLSQLQRIDTLASSGSVPSALSRLERLSKKQLPVEQRLSVYRRMMDLGAEAAAER
jgi:hypothetical protein